MNPTGILRFVDDEDVAVGLAGGRERGVGETDRPRFDHTSWAGVPERAVGVERRSFNAHEVATFDDLDENGWVPVDDLDENQRALVLGDCFDTLADLAALGLSCPYVAWLQAAECPEGQRIYFWLEEKDELNANFGTGCLVVSGEGKAGTAWFQC